MDKTFASCRENLAAKARWETIHSEYKRENIIYDDWLQRFEAELLSCGTPIIDLGCGSGNNTKYLLERGKSVIACDYSTKAISNITNNFPELHGEKCFDMTEGMPFEDNFTELIIADLSLHYFPADITRQILEEIKRVLTPKGTLLIRVNSINDTNHGAGEGEEIEHHLYKSEDGRLKRFFDRDDINSVFSNWDIIYAEESEMRRYALPKMLWTVVLKPNK